MTIQAPDPVAEVEGIVKAVVVLVIVGSLIWLVWDNHSLTKEVAQQKAEITDYQTANKEFADQVAKQNAAISNLQAEAKARSAAADKIVAAARKDAQAMYDRAAKIMTETPKLADDCAAAKNLLNSYFGGQ